MAKIFLSLKGYKINTTLSVLTKCLAIGRLGGVYYRKCIRVLIGSAKEKWGLYDGIIGGFSFSRSIGKTPAARGIASFLPVVFFL